MPSNNQQPSQSPQTPSHDENRGDKDTDARIGEHDPKARDNQFDDLSGAQLDRAQHDLEERQLDVRDSQLGSADESADDEKKKYIAQHGADRNAQLTSQDVPSPRDNEGKDLQNEKALEEHIAKGFPADGNPRNDEERERMEKAGLL